VAWNKRISSMIGQHRRSSANVGDTNSSEAILGCPSLVVLAMLTIASTPSWYRSIAIRRNLALMWLVSIAWPDTDWV
jgi:hypothetical protein